MKLSKKQKEIIKLMREGYPMMIGVSDTGVPFYMIASTHNNEYGDTYFSGRVFSNLLEKGLIYQQLSLPYDYVLTKEGREIKI